MSFALVTYLGGSTGGIQPSGSHLSDGETLLTLGPFCSSMTPDCGAH